MLYSCAGTTDYSNSLKSFNLNLIPCAFQQGNKDIYTYIDANGMPVLEFDGSRHEHSALSPFYLGRAFVKTLDFKGFIDTEGNELFAIEGLANPYMTDNLAITVNDKIVTAYDANGDEAFAFEAKACTPMCEGYAIFTDRHNQNGIINRNGEIILDPSDDEYVMRWFSKYSLASMAHPTYFQIMSKDGYQYILDAETGKHYLEDCIPEDVNTNVELHIDCNNMVVAMTHDNKYGLLDLEGNWIVEPEYSLLKNDGEWYIFRENNNSLLGWIDKTGEIKIEPIADPPHYCWWYGFGFNDVSYIGNGCFINRVGDIVLETDYDIDSNFVGDRCLVDKGRQGHVWINREGEEISDPFFPTENAREAIRHLSIGNSPQYFKLYSL